MEELIQQTTDDQNQELANALISETMSELSIEAIDARIRSLEPLDRVYTLIFLMHIMRRYGATGIKSQEARNWVQKENSLIRALGGVVTPSFNEIMTLDRLKELTETFEMTAAYGG